MEGSPVTLVVDPLAVTLIESSPDVPSTIRLSVSPSEAFVARNGAIKSAPTTESEPAASSLNR
jgi:hypothetical protein